MDNWYLLSLAALLLLGGQRFLYKVAAERNCSSSLTTAVFMATVSLLSAVLYLSSPPQSQPLTTLVGLSLLNSTAFALSTIAHIEALRYLPAAIVFPLTRLSLLVVVLVSVVSFDERLGPLAWCGILLGFGVVLVLTPEARGATRVEDNPRSGLLFILVCVASSALAAISSKLAADSVSLSGFMTLSYLFGMLFSLGIERKRRRSSATAPAREAVWLGIFMGLLNFLGFYAFLSALTRGPLSVIAMITGMHFVIAIGLSMLIYQERLSLRRVLALGLTLLAIVLLRS